MKPLDVSGFASTQLALLANEQAAEVAETSSLTAASSPAALFRAGLALLNLVVGAQRTGLGGKTVLELEPDSGVSAELPEHGIRVGDIVGVQEQPAGAAKKKEKNELKAKGVEGVVIRVGQKGVQVALDKEDPDVPSGRLWLLKLANDVTYKRMNETMKRMKEMKEQDHTKLMQVLFGLSSPYPVLHGAKSSIGDITWTEPSLNDSQKAAIAFAMASQDIALIHGPPGTGKTHTLIELILQLLKQNQRLLVCGPSNISVDNIVERLSPQKVPMVRLGHPARLLPNVLNHSLDVLTRTSEASAIVQDIRKELDEKQAKIHKARYSRERRGIYAEMRELRREFRDREKKCISDLVRASKVVLATLHGAGGYQLKNERFDVVIVDEASQALEAQCWVALLTAKRVVLAGDHLQLPPTVKSVNIKGPQNAPVEAVPGGETLETTLFDRLLKLHGPSIKRMLTTQYRMHERIMSFPSQELYDAKLVAAESVKARLLKDLPYEVQDTDDTREPLVFWDTQGGEFPEKTEDEGFAAKGGKGRLRESKSNEMEAALVKLHVERLLSAGVAPEDIAVVTPYNAQLALLSQMLKEAHPGLELGSVDGFQGREKEAVVVSLVRSNEEHEVGFLGERRRLNVAMTRPKRHLCVVGDSDTVSRGSSFLKKWMAYLEEHADLRYPMIDELS